jgi:hypothetical protein
MIGNLNFDVSCAAARTLRRTSQSVWPSSQRDGASEILLLRCNGPHGGYNDSFDPNNPHWGFHVHRASAAMIEAGLRPERIATATKEFASYEEALQYFFSTTNVTDAWPHFPDVAQGTLPFPPGENPNQ